MRQGFDLEMKRRHIGKQASLHEFFPIRLGLGAMSDRAIEKASDGSRGLQESRNAEVVECWCKVCHVEIVPKSGHIITTDALALVHPLGPRRKYL